MTKKQYLDLTGLETYDGEIKAYINSTVSSKANATDLTSHTNNKSNPHGVTASQVGALPSSGGNLTGVIDASGTSNILDFGTSGWFRGKTTSGSRYDIFGYSNPTTLQIGGSYPALALKGKNSRPTYNNNDIALLSDVPDISGKADKTHIHTVSEVTNLQSTLDGKQATITGGATTITGSNLTANRALISNGSGKVAVSDITNTELGYLDGVTSNIQAQLDAKAAASTLSSHTDNKSNPHGVTKAQVGLGNVENKSSATIRGELTKSNVTTALGYTPPTTDTNTTYTFVTGDANGQIKVTPSGGSAQNISVKGLGSAAYTNSSAYATSGHTHNYAGSSSAGGAATTALTCTGNSATATKATQDASGNVITSTYMTKANPTGTGSLSMNRKVNTTVGDYSVALGQNCTASGQYSHAEGDSTTASGIQSHAEGANSLASGSISHAEGYFTQASGYASHAEGAGRDKDGQDASYTISATEYPIIGSSDITVNTTTASGDVSHAEGLCTFAFGNYSHAEGGSSVALGEASHAEGYSTAVGDGSHAEGFNTIAKGDYSHAEGSGTKASGDCSHTSGMGTYAPGEAQFVIGKYNGKFDVQTYNDLAFIIGNGTSSTERSNALTVDWEGTVEAGRFVTPNNRAFRTVNTDGSVVAAIYVNTNNDLMVGSSSYPHLRNTSINAPNGSVILSGSSGTTALNGIKTTKLAASDASAFGSTLSIGGITTIDKRIQPAADGDSSDYVQLGASSARFKYVYCMQSAMTTSDLNAKRDLSSIDDRYIELFDLIEPYAYYFNNGDRVHTGFISQYVEDAMVKVGLTAEELGFFCKDIKIKYHYDEDGNYIGEEKVYDEYGNPIYIYSLRYEEYIAIMAEKIKRLEKKYNSKIEELETQVADQEERIAKLEALIA